MKSGLLYIIACTALIYCSCSAGSQYGQVMLKTDVIAAEDNAVFVQVTSDGSWTLSLDFSGQEEWAQLSRTSGTGSSNSIVLACETNTSGNPRSVTVIADFRDNSSSTVLVQLGAEESLSPDPEFPGLESDPVRTWMELPEMHSEKGCAWVFHNMNIGGGRVVRNYSLFYDAEK